jgi:hypothetical protein
MSVPVPMGVTTTPPLPKPASRLPSALKRSSSWSRSQPVPTEPDTTILPSDCTATASPYSSVAPRSSTTWPAAAEAAVQAAVGIQAHQQQVVFAAVVGPAGGEDLAVGLQGQTSQNVHVRSRSERDQRVAGGPKAGVELAIGQQA